MRLAPAPGGVFGGPPGATGAPVAGVTRGPPPGAGAGELDGTVPAGDGPIDPSAGWPGAVPGGEAGLTAGAPAGTLPVLAACGSAVGDGAGASVCRAAAGCTRHTVRTRL